MLIGKPGVPRDESRPEIQTESLRRLVHSTAIRENKISRRCVDLREKKEWEQKKDAEMRKYKGT